MCHHLVNPSQNNPRWNSAHRRLHGSLQQQRQRRRGESTVQVSADVYGSLSVGARPSIRRSAVGRGPVPGPISAGICRASLLLTGPPARPCAGRFISISRACRCAAPAARWTAPRSDTSPASVCSDSPPRRVFNLTSRRYPQQRPQRPHHSEWHLPHPQSPQSPQHPSPATAAAPSRPAAAVAVYDNCRRILCRAGREPPWTTGRSPSRRITISKRPYKLGTHWRTGRPARRPDGAGWVGATEPEWRRCGPRVLTGICRFIGSSSAAQHGAVYVQGGVISAATDNLCADEGCYGRHRQLESGRTAPNGPKCSQQSARYHSARRR